MSIARRVTQLERDLGPPSARRSATHALLIEDPSLPVPAAELQAFLEAIAPEGGLAVFRLPDNGRDARGPHISYGGAGWDEAGPDIRDGHIVAWCQDGATPA